ncbi:DNA ligase [Alteromonas gracilis]|uniref:DNA ligase n=1 Tax=Alteromonas gracilis TaxID=1479524 RepID=UPI003736EC1E
MKHQSALQQLVWHTALAVGITVCTSGCSTLTAQQTEHCITQANSANVHEVNTANEQLNACLETYQLQRDEERTTGEAIAEDVIFSIIDIVTR